jgi:hypothetical protein
MHPLSSSLSLLKLYTFKSSSRKPQDQMQLYIARTILVGSFTSFFFVCTVCQKRTISVHMTFIGERYQAFSSDAAELIEPILYI